MNHTIENEFLRVTASEQGAQLQSVLGADGTQYLWQGDSRYWPDRALNIFPYVARLNQGIYYLDGKQYHMDIHGLAPYCRFRLAEKTPCRMVLELRSDEQTYACYPRHFTFRIGYTLAENVLEVEFVVENRDGRTMYFGLGGHPGFNIPLTARERFEDYRLRFSRPCRPRRVIFSANALRTGEDVPYPLEQERGISLRHELFDNDAIVLMDADREVTLESVSGSRSVTVAFPDAPYVGFWHWPKTDAPYVCVEPWYSLPSAEGEITVLEEKEDLLRLEAGKTYRTAWSIRVNTK